MDYNLVTGTPVTAATIANQLFFAYSDRKDRLPVSGYTSSDRFLVTEGRMPYPDHHTAFGQRRIVLEVSIDGGPTTSGVTATSFKVKAGSEMVNPDKLPSMVREVQAALGGK